MSEVVVPGKALGKLNARFIKGLPSIGAITAQLPPPPAEVRNSGNLRHLGYMANDRIGDCTCVLIGHAIQVWTSMANTEFVVPDRDIIDLYSAVSGYVPGDSNTDAGAVLSEVLLYWYRHPLIGHALAGFASIRPGNRTSIRDAIYLFGVCGLGVQLPLTAQHGDWILPKGQTLTGDWVPGSWGGHAIPACDYNEDGVTVLSWGKLIKVSWDWLDAYCDEAYALLSRDWLQATGNSPPGLNITELQQDMNSLRISP